MSHTLAPDYVRQLRNHIAIITLIADVLHLDYHTHDGRFRFLCPLCHAFDTAANPTTNLARCFHCQRNFNPIDIVMTVKRYSFMQAVRFLDPFLPRATLPPLPCHRPPLSPATSS
jgi:hypothetical protein